MHRAGARGFAEPGERVTSRVAPAGVDVKALREALDRQGVAVST